MAERAVIRSPAAEDDLADIWLTIALDNPFAADRLLDKIAFGIRQLAVFPDSGPLRPVIAPAARALTVGNYVVLYRHNPDDVEVIRVVHGARDVTTLL